MKRIYLRVIAVACYVTAAAAFVLSSYYGFQAKYGDVTTNRALPAIFSTVAAVVAFLVGALGYAFWTESNEQ